MFHNSISEVNVQKLLYSALYRLHACRRSWQVERRIAKEHRYYKIKAAGHINSRPIGVRLRERLASRGVVVSPKPMGDLHVVYATRPSNWEPHNIPPQLAPFGEVSSYLYAERGFDDSDPNWLHRRHEMDSDLLRFVREQHRRQPIDVFLSYLSGWQVAPETICAIGEMGIVTCAFHWDDKLSFRGMMAGGRWSGPAAVAAAYDLNLTNSPSSIVKYEVEGGLAMFWPEAANPDHFRPLDISFDYDVSFVGACYGYRPILVDYLRREGIRIDAFGPGWPNGPVSEDEMVNLYARSRINLGFGGIGYSTQVHCLKGRDFEVPMCGSLYLTSDNPELELIYDIDKEILTYRNKEECCEKIHYVLANQNEANAIRQAARRRCLMDHTWAVRFRTLLTTIGFLMEDEAMGTLKAHA